MNLERIRGWTSIALGGACLFIALRTVLELFLQNRNIPGSLVVVGGALVLGVGLIARWRLPRRIAAALCLVIAVVLPIGVINPFAAMEVANPPPVGAILRWMVPVVVVLVLVAWLVDPHGQPKKK